jgi:hypothetical protein
LHVPRVLINRVKDLNIALSGKFVSVWKILRFFVLAHFCRLLFLLPYSWSGHFSVAGKYNDKEQQTVETACIESAPGTFSPTRGEATFTLCPLGQWQNMTGSTACNKCDFNTYNDKIGRAACRERGY